MSTPAKNAKLARRFAVSARTIGRWRKAGAPLQSKIKMKAWLLARASPGAAIDYPAMDAALVREAKRMLS